MAYDPNTTPPPRRRATGPGTWIAIAIAVLIIAALIWWFFAGLNDDEGEGIVDEGVGVEEPLEEEPLEEEPLEEEEEGGAYRFQPDRQVAFTVDGVGVMIAA